MARGTFFTRQQIIARDITMHFLTNRHAFLSLLVAAFSFSLNGCSDRPALAPAGGKVTLDGRPMPSAVVTFQPVEGGRLGTAETDADGVYQITTFGPDVDGAIVGDHFVGVVRMGGAGASKPAGEQPADANSLSSLGAASDEESKKQESDIQYIVPKKYMAPSQSGLKVTVPSGGSDQLNLELKSK